MAPVAGNWEQRAAANWEQQQKTRTQQQQTGSEQLLLVEIL
jgi:hypothetical protein